jgi:hypothetical protein
VKRTFRALLLEGISKFAESGYTSEGELQEWLGRLHEALDRELPSDEESKKTLARILEGIYERDMRSGLVKRVPGVSRYTLDRVAPYLRAELDRRIWAGADLIKLRKRAATQQSLQRFAGWTTSVPPRGFPRIPKNDLRDVVREIGMPIASLKYERRRLAIDQGHKMMAATASVVAEGEGAIAAIWHDRGVEDRGYDARPEHLARSGKLFLIRDSWAIKDGLIRKGSAQYTDEIEQPAQLVYCSCTYEYVVHLQELPDKLLTAKGRAWVSGVRLDSAPSASQIEAGNYPKGHIRMYGLDISIETRAGETRSGVGPDGQPWSVVLPADYGYIRRTLGADGDHLDCYIGPNADAPLVWVVDQHDAETRVFDEQKVLMGFNARSQAIETYESGFSDGKGRLRIGKVHEFTAEDFRRTIKDEPEAVLSA